MSASRPLRLVLGDRHLMLMEGLSSALASAGHHVEAMCATPTAIVGAVVRCRPDVCVLDLDFPDHGGLDALQGVVDIAPVTKVLVLSAALTPELVRHAVEIGVHGLLTKNVGFADIMSALDRMAGGEIIVNGPMLRDAMRATSNRTSSVTNDLVRTLTSREREVLTCLADGDDTAAIASGLSISPSTARNHVQNVLVKLGVHSRLHAVLYARLHGFVAA